MGTPNIGSAQSALATITERVDAAEPVKSEPVDTSPAKDVANRSITSDASEFGVKTLPDVDISEFGESHGLADVTLIVEDVRIPVIKSVLSMASPVFRAMFQGEFKERNQSEITLPVKELLPFLSFLRCIYPDKKGQVSDKIALSILPLTSEYQVDLRNKCEDCLVDVVNANVQFPRSYPCEKYCFYLNVAETFSLSRLRVLCIGVLSDYSLDSRQQYIRSNAISTGTEAEITTLACRKHELYRRYFDTLIDNLPITRDQLYSSIRAMDRRPMREREIAKDLQLLRLAFHLDYKLYNELLTQFCHLFNNISEYDEYNFLPEKIKLDLHQRTNW